MDYSSLIKFDGKKEYDKITVTEICRIADLDRRTFYRNFNSKNDVLEEYIRLLGEEYLKMYADLDKRDKFNSTKLFLNFGVSILILSGILKNVV